MQGEPRPMTAGEALWRRRYRAARMSLPDWAIDAPERLVYASNAGGKWELWAWDRQADTHLRMTDRAEGTLHGRLDPLGEALWWFDDEKGNEFGCWVVQPFGAQPAQGARPASDGLTPA